MRTDIDTSEASGGNPVERLIKLGMPDDLSDSDSDWADYPAAFGLTQDHIDALISVACDPARQNAKSESAEVWAPVHAWRALGQLRAEAAVAPLLAILALVDGDDYANTELPIVFGLIGPPAVPQIAAFLSDRSRPAVMLQTALGGLPEVVANYPECRDKCIAVLTAVLDQHPEGDPVVNGFAVSALLDLEALEAIDAMRAAFGRGAVDLSIAGDMEDVEIELGLRNRRVTPARRHPLMASLPSLLGTSPATHDRQPVRREKIGRNDPCPCGSGKKYKKCCLPAAG